MNGSILLINIDSNHSVGYGKLRNIAPTDVPLGLAYIAAYLEARGIKVDIIDTQLQDLSQPLLESYLKNNRYIYVGMNAVTSTFHKASDASLMIKKIDGKIKVVVGGVHPSVVPEESIKNENVDIIVRGEGEKTAFNLAKAIRDGTSLKEVKGISYKEGEEIISTGPGDLIENLDDIPMPARHLFGVEKYNPPPDMVYQHPSFGMITSRGCPGRCIFCSPRSVSGRKYRFNSAPRVIEEIKLLIDRYKARQVIFYDDAFLAHRPRAIEILKEMIDSGISRRIVWFCASRVDHVTQDLLYLMKKAGCIVISYGIESAQQRSLDLIKKGTTIKMITDAVKWTRNAGIECRATFMLGIPGETKADALNTIDFAKKLKLDRAKFTIITPYPGTELYDMIKDDIISSWDEYSTFSGYTEFNPVYHPKEISAQELKSLQRRAMREFYFRPVQVLRVARSIRTFQQVKNLFKASIAFFPGR